MARVGQHRSRLPYGLKTAPSLSLWEGWAVDNWDGVFDDASGVVAGCVFLRVPEERIPCSMEPRSTLRTR